MPDELPVVLPFILMNAGGWARSPERVATLCEAPLTTHIEIGSFTVNPRPGREGGTTFDVLDDGTAGNNLNMPNDGIPYLVRHGVEMVRRAHDAGKQLWVNGAPFSPEEDGQLAYAAATIGADAYVSNRGCPNTDRAIISYDHQMMRACDEEVRIAIGDYPWWRKVSPYANPAERVIEAGLTAKSSAQGIIACNTFANVRLRRNGKPIITATGTNGLGGMSGTGIFYVNLANAEHFCELLADSGRMVVGCGGVRSGAAMQAYILAGCVGVQVAAAFFESEDPRALQNIGEEWARDHYR